MYITCITNCKLRYRSTTITYFSVIQGRYEKTQEEKFRQISDLQDQVEKLKVDNKEANKYIRELEQRNDDLERDNRLEKYFILSVRFVVDQ